MDHTEWHDELEAAFWEDLIYEDYLGESRIPDRLDLRRMIQHGEMPDDTTFLNLATVQRIILCDLQKQIIDQVGVLQSREPNHKFDAKILHEMKTLMTDYAQAVRAWDLMVQHAENAGHQRSQDPFIITSKWPRISRVMAAAGILKTPDADNKTINQEVKVPNYDSIPFSRRSRTRKDHHTSAFLKRFIAALLGGVAVVGPMFIMVLHNDRTTTLSTASAAVVLFALMVASYSSAPPEVLWSVVAAYAAVMVVFVGANH
ncbi:hypothetical protein BJY01DRAFT_250303 [Aspergillus pseudoustus]|uniref:DUF6594 domain-containing protein n=1 Tax=Aspergillus pseudoustus TaxID=1810923 RepID=A0ABR4JIF3_9EURO